VWYYPRGQAENVLKDLKRAAAADRLSCHAFRANASPNSSRSGDSRNRFSA